MAKLTKAEMKAHDAAVALLGKDTLTVEERFFVLDNWQEGATHMNARAGAFFTPEGLAADFCIEALPGRVIDMCAGIGRLAAHAMEFHRWSNVKITELICIENNPDYVAVGRKVVPEATWICADVFDLPRLGLGMFDFAMANPPFGKIKRASVAPRYTGGTFEYAVIDVARDFAKNGAFIIPQMSAPFAYSGRQHYSVQRSDAYEKFVRETGIELSLGCSIDTSYHRDAWRGVAPMVEIVTTDFAEARERTAPMQQAMAV